ncbi:MAG: putative aldo/keto reductase-like oxidoreductase [Limisphaerales bacterium]|jgi:predicted aldo/keto reductase-like oxidoreductase
MSERRKFIKQTALVGAGSLLASTSSQAITPPQQVKNAHVQSYRRLGRTELEVSDISFGSSRLRTGSERLIDHALARGVNYIDTAEGYTNGQSETVIGNALKGKRDQAYLVSKTMTSPRTSSETMMHDLEGSLKRLQTDYVDIYMNHAVNDIDVVANAEWAEFVVKAKQQGKIRFTGVSGHAGHLIECLDFAIDEDLVDVILSAYNFGQDPKFYEGLTRGIDWIATQPDLPRVLAKAKKHDIGVVAMKTLMGARLNDMRSYERTGKTFAQSAFSWVLSNPHVDALIVTMTGEAQIDEYLGASGASNVDKQARYLLDKYADLNGANYCTHACNLCEGSCPHDVPIADVLRTRMYATDYQDVAFAQSEYGLLATNASACLTCSGAPCQDACPNGIEINQLCAPTHRMLNTHRLA